MYARLVGPQTSGNSPVSASHLTIGVLGLGLLQPFVVSGDPNPDSHSCTASTLPTQDKHDLLAEKVKAEMPGDVYCAE